MNKKVKDFAEGDHLVVDLLVSSLVKGTTNNGAPYLSLTLQDSTKSMEAKMWDVKTEVEKAMEVGNVYQFDLEVIKYRNNLQAKVLKVLPLAQNDINKEEFVFKSPISKDVLRNEISEAVNSIGNENIARIVSAMINRYSADVYEYPAAAKIHHNFIGGLATHMSGMVKLGKTVAELYPQVNRDYLLAGILLHDLGKIEELTSPVVTEYSPEGKLLGHISIMDARLLEVGTQLKLQDSEELMVLRHMILSHHGQFEFGSPVRPQTLEAELLFLIDNIDAKVNTICKALDEVNEGEFTQKLFALENRVFYKHK